MADLALATVRRNSRCLSKKEQSGPHLRSLLALASLAIVFVSGVVVKNLYRGQR